MKKVLYFYDETFTQRDFKLQSLFFTEDYQKIQRLKATFYFNEEVLIEFPSYRNQWRREFFKKISLHLLWDHQKSSPICYTRPDRKSQVPLYNFPLNQVCKIETEPYQAKPRVSKNIFKRLSGLWDNLEANLQARFGGQKTIHLKELINEYEWECLKDSILNQEDFSLSRFTNNDFIQLETKQGADGVFRAWLLKEDEEYGEEEHYMILNYDHAVQLEKSQFDQCF